MPWQTPLPPEEKLPSSDYPLDASPEALWKVLTELGADRKSLVINLGGGVVTDLGGFVASTFKRGVDFINIPTTLLSMVDASVGGKTGVDLDLSKNQIGTITFADMVLVDPEFLDVKDVNWKWKEDDEFVPIIMPREFLVMLNTFMSASGIPQVSDDLAKDIKFKFTLSNEDNSKKEWVDARIIGFTNEVSSLLVPEAFMTYGNNKFSDGNEQKITQIMISGEEREFGLVEELLTKRGLESKNAQMVVGRLKSMVGTLFLVVLGISVIAVFVSGLVLIQYMQLLMSRNAYEVRTLLRIGYPPQEIIRKFFFNFVKIFGIVAGLGLSVFFVFKYFLDEMFETGGLYIDTGMTLGSIGALFFAYLIFTIASYRTAKKGIFKEY
mgnify:CR=1 FL=1